MQAAWLSRPSAFSDFELLRNRLRSPVGDNLYKDIKKREPEGLFFHKIEMADTPTLGIVESQTLVQIQL